MLKKLILINLINNLSIVNCFTNDYSNNNKSSYMLSFDNISVFRDSKGNFYYKQNNAILDANNTIVIILDKNGTPINRNNDSIRINDSIKIGYYNKFETNDFIKIGYLKKIVEFKDLNNNLYSIRNDKNGKITIYDSNGNIVILTDNKGKSIKI